MKLSLVKGVDSEVAEEASVEKEADLEVKTVKIDLPDHSVVTDQEVVNSVEIEADSVVIEADSVDLEEVRIDQEVNTVVQEEVTEVASVESPEEVPEKAPEEVTSTTIDELRREIFCHTFL